MIGGRRSLPRPGLADLLLLGVPFLALFPLRNNDLWWHLAAGRWMAASGTWPSGDPFSFTGFMGEWVDNEWLSQLALYGAFTVGGNLGLVALRAALYSLTFVLVRAWLRRGRRPSMFLPCLAGGIALSYGWWEIRPSLFSILGTLALVLILERVRRSGRGLVRLPILFGVWASTHPGFLFGVCVLVGTVAAVYAEPLLPRWPRWSTVAGVRNRLAAWTVVSVAATLVNPYGWKVYAQQLSIAGNAAYRALLDEWAPPGPAFQALVLGTLAAVIVLRFRRAAAAELIPILGASALATTAVRFEEYFALVALPGAFRLLAGARPRAARNAVLGLALAASLLLGLRSPLSRGFGEGDPSAGARDAVEERVDARMRRNAVVLATVLAASVALALRRRPRGLWPGRSGRSLVGGPALASTVAVATLLAALAAGTGRTPEDHVEPGRYPNTCLAALPRGEERVFHRLSWGGWLIWRAGIRTFVDGRCWGQPIFFEYRRCHGAGCGALLDEQRIDRVIVGTSDPAVAFLEDDPRWTVVCRDSASVVLGRVP